MYKFSIKGVENTNQYEELIKVFLSQGEFVITDNPKEEDVHVFTFDGDRDALKRDIYQCLEKITGRSPKWGILTGIRPVKLAGEIYDTLHDYSHVMNTFKEDYLLHESKYELITEIHDYQRRLLGRPPENSLSMYIGIPFCPTRCLYCSFTSNQVEESEITRYLDALHQEINYCSARLNNGKEKVESIYIGGGTPTTPAANLIESLMKNITSNIDIGELKEFTVEAGRPDTITEDKLRVLKHYGVDRISINPQSMKQETLDIIGRSHTTKQTLKAFEMARKVGFKCINTDLIAGLPGENIEDFKVSLNKMIDLGAENITVHTLAVKRASRLKEVDADFNYKREEICEEMLSYAHEKLYKEGYKPYYLYRQKHTSGNTENIGFCKEDLISAYNVRIMEEAQSILALGAGGISKVYYPTENRLERVPNVSNYEIYIERINEMINRKEENFWR